jgi:sigma-54 dependent transcriptional regulator, acetoin dehydrogenase operon transcriptional activator AcoR
MAQGLGSGEPNVKDTLVQWNKFVRGETVDKSKVSLNVYESWLRSMAYGVDPYSINEELLMTEREFEQNFAKLEILEKKYGDILVLMKEITMKTGLRFQIFDKYAKSVYLIVVDLDIEKYNRSNSFYLKNVAEDQIGTTAVSLALRENIPVQLFYHEHFHTMLHKANCSAAPIHDIHGQLTGVLNISSFDSKQTIETLGLATTLAKIFNDNLMINHMLGELTHYNATLNEIIEYLPKGILYLNHENQVDKYNKKILDLFNITNRQDIDTVKIALEKQIEKINTIISQDKDFSHKEVVLDIHEEKKSFLISTKNILDHMNQKKGTIVIFEETNTIIRLNSALRGNQAFYTFYDIITQNTKMIQLKKTAELIAKSPSSVLIHGESGTGKELFAQAIHNSSNRKNKSFVAINCGAIPQELIESELFGYEPGAFTGALKGGKPGKLEIASEGTLFLDEVESMPLITQIKLLRALSSGKISRVGSIKEIPIDIRLISATKKDLLEEAKIGHFREDLYYRIKIITLQLPPLRERLDDIPVLAKHFANLFLKQFNIPKIEISREFIHALSCSNWQGNLRELKNVIERSIALLGNQRELTIDSLPDTIIDAYKYKDLKSSILSTVNKINTSKKGLLEVGEEIIIDMILEESKTNISKAADILGISRPTLYKKIYQSEKLKCKYSKHFK